MNSCTLLIHNGLLLNAKINCQNRIAIPYKKTNHRADLIEKKDCPINNPKRRLNNATAVIRFRLYVQ